MSAPHDQQRLGWLAAVALGLGLAWAGGRAARSEEPLYLQEPFDRITLNAENNKAVLLVRPLDLPERKVPAHPDPSEKLILRLLDQPERQYELEWRAIARVELFENLLLAQAVELVTAGKFDEAYDHFQFLDQHYPKLSGLAAAREDSLLAEAKETARQGQFDAALALLRELHDRNPTRPELERAIPVTTDKLVEKYHAAGNYVPGRRLVRSLAAWYPQDAVAAKWEAQWKNEAGTLLKQGQEALQAGRFREADEASRRLVQVWPELAGAKELAAAIHQKYPRVVVGVLSPAAAPDPARWDDWAARRSGRLLHRMLAEYAGAGAQGGNYACPLGEIELDVPGRRVRLTLRPDQPWSAGQAPLVAYDAARGLLARAEPANPAYRADWADLLGELEVYGVFRLDAALRRIHLRPEAFLQTPVFPYTDPSVADPLAACNGPYLLDARAGNQTCYVLNSRHAATPGRPKEIVELVFHDPGKATDALEHGLIRAIDRIVPAELKDLRAMKQVRVEPYGAPLVHCLIPHHSRPLVQNRTFRRALLYGIHREAILRQILSGADLPGCQVLSGPFPCGTGADDPLGYAYDNAIAPRPYDPRLAITLAAQAYREVAKALKNVEKEPKASRQLVVAHPADPIARTACAAIQQQMQVLGIEVSLQELAPGAPPTCPDNADLLYAELAVWEPLVDARRLLGEDGLAGRCSPPLSLALRQLEQAADWMQICTRLKQIHRLAADDVALIPLWQMVDCCAYHETLQGIGNRPITLYQNVEHWQAAFHYPAE